MRVIVLVLLLFFIAVIVNGTLAVRFDNKDVFAQYNVLFDADPNTRLPGFTGGKNGAGRTLVHPNLSNIVYPPVLLTSKILSLFGFPENGQDARRFTALMVTPAVSGISAGVLFFTGLVLGLGLLRSFLLGLLLLASFSQLVFGSIPDHFALGGLGIALTMLCVAMEARGRPPPVLIWVAVGWFAASITITNILLVASAYGVCCLKRLSLPRTAVRAIAMGLSSIVLVFVFKGSVDLVFGHGGAPITSDQVEKTREFSGAYLDPEPLRKLVKYPAAIGQAIMPGTILQREIEIRPKWSESIKERMRNARYQHMFVVPDRYSEAKFPRLILGLCGLVLLVYLVIGSIRYWRNRDDPRALVAASSLAILVINGLFHGLWGNEYFLYSQHWLAASLVPLALLCSSGRIRWSVSTTIMSLIVAAAILVNTYWISHLFNALELI